MNQAREIITARPDQTELDPSPFPQEWILDGDPQAHGKQITQSGDGSMSVFVWSCTKGRFRWRYTIDEMVHIVAGEVFITNHLGIERRLGSGDTAFFPAGTSSIWRVPESVRKVAVCHVPTPALVTLALRIWNRIWTGFAARFKLHCSSENPLKSPNEVPSKL